VQDFYLFPVLAYSRRCNFSNDKNRSFSTQESVLRRNAGITSAYLL